MVFKFYCQISSIHFCSQVSAYLKCIRLVQWPCGNCFRTCKVILWSTEMSSYIFSLLTFTLTLSIRYGNRLVLVASQELRERALTPVGSDPCLDMPNVQYGLLEVVGAARHYGISRPFVSTKYLKVDARSVFFYVKQLTKKGLIQVKVNSISENLNCFSFHSFHFCT